MEDLQKLRSRLSSKLVDLEVEKKRLQDLEEKLKLKYDISASDVKQEYKKTKNEKEKLEEEFSRREAKLSKKLRRYME